MGGRTELSRWELQKKARLPRRTVRSDPLHAPSSMWVSRSSWARAFGTTCGPPPAPSFRPAPGALIAKRGARPPLVIYSFARCRQLAGSARGWRGKCAHTSPACFFCSADFLSRGEPVCILFVPRESPTARSRVTGSPGVLHAHALVDLERARLPRRTVRINERLHAPSSRCRGASRGA